MTYDVKLTEQQSEFCRLIVFDRLPQYKAYMHVFGVSQAVAHVEACKLMKNPRIQEEIRRLRDIKSQDAEWEFDDSVNALKGVVKDPESHVVLVSAVKELNKMFGWDKTTIDHISSDKSMSPTFATMYGKPKSES